MHRTALGQRHVWRPGLQRLKHNIRGSLDRGNAPNPRGRMLRLRENRREDKAGRLRA